MGLLQSGHLDEVYAGLTMLLETCKIYRWKSGDGRAGLDQIITTAFPVALQIANRLLADPSPAAATMLVLILKAYKCAIAVCHVMRS
jgi:importin-7